MKKIILGLGMLVLVSSTVNAQKEVIVINKTTKSSTDNPLIVVDGIISEAAKMDDYDPSNIESVNVLKGTMATKKYGRKGEKGAVEIKLKKNIAPIANDTDKKPTVDTNINLSIMIDGDKITINGKPADKNDPRLKIVGTSKIKRFEKGNKAPNNVIIQDITEDNDSNEGEEMGSDDVLDMVSPPTPPTNKAFLGVISEENEKGAKINTVSEGSPAEKAGLKKEDIISKVNDKIIDGPKSLYEAIGAFKADDKITITFIREGKEQTTTTTLAKNKALNSPKAFSFNFPNGQMPNNSGREFRIRPDQNFNFEMPELDALNSRFNRKPKLGISVEDIEAGEGVKIKNVNAGTPAEKAGFKANDIIIQFDENKVTDVNDLKWNYLQEGQVLKFTVLRNGEKKKIEVKIPKKLKSADL
jgi:serine protease Do